MSRVPAASRVSPLRRDIQNLNEDVRELRGELRETRKEFAELRRDYPVMPQARGTRAAALAAVLAGLVNFLMQLWPAASEAMK